MNLSEMFAHSQGEPIEVEGQLVHPIYKRTVRPNEELRLTVVRAREAPVHGIRMKLKAGLLQIADREPAGNVVLWTDRAPKSVVFRCQSKKPSELRIWNCWRDERNVMQAWIGSAGMIIEEKTDGTARLLCNSGHEVTFQDLVLELEAL